MVTLLGIILASSLLAQVEIPANPIVKPGKSAARSIGGGTDPGVSIVPAKPDQRYVTHIVLSESRLWTSSDGKPLEAKLIAFEDLVASVPQGSAEPVMPPPPAHPTVVRDGNVRLLVNKKPVTLALDRLSEGDRAFVENVRTSLARKAAAGK